jgi:hypothetical protein
MTEFIAEPYFAEVDPRIPFNPDPCDPTPDEIIAHARTLEQGIRDDPERFQTALLALGNTATSTKIDRLGQRLDSSAKDATTLIISYFASGCDRSVEFDSATDEALSKDPAYLAALAEHKKAQIQTVLVTNATHGTRPDPNATPARDAVRRIQLAFYIRRVISWQGQQPMQVAS